MKNSVRCRCRGHRENVVAVLARELRAVVEAGDAATIRWLRGEATDADHAAMTKAERASRWLASPPRTEDGSHV